MINDDQLGDGQDDDEESLNRDDLREIMMGDQENDVRIMNDDQGDARRQEMLMMPTPSTSEGMSDTVESLPEEQGDSLGPSMNPAMALQYTQHGPLYF